MKAIANTSYYTIGRLNCDVYEYVSFNYDRYGHKYCPEITTSLMSAVKYAKFDSANKELSIINKSIGKDNEFKILTIELKI